MTDHKVVSQAKLQASRADLLQREKEHTRAGDEGDARQLLIRRHDEYV